MMAQFWVVGGEYRDSGFRDMARGCDEEWIGPYDDYDSAMAEWNKRAWTKVDVATTRYRIERIDPDAPPPCTD